MQYSFSLDDGLQLAADASGPEAGPPVVLLHGFGQTRRAWNKTAAVLAQRGFRAYSVDLRGHGQSSWAGQGGYELDHYSRDVRGIVRQLGRPVSLVGASLGGISSLMACGEEPAAAAKCLVLVDITSRISQDGVNKIQQFMESNMEGFANVEAAAASVSEYLPHRAPPKDLSGLMNNLRKADDGRLYWHWDPAALRMGGWDSQDEIDLRIERAARRLDIPTLVLRGGRSELVSPESARAFVKLLKHGELADIDDAHHMVAGDQNDAFTEVLVEFVSRNG